MNDIELCLPNISDGEDKSSPFINCLRNSYRHLRKWAKRTYTDCFRIYDRDIPQFPLAIDLYAGRICVHYFSRGKDTDEPSPELKEEVTKALCTLFGVTVPMIYWRTRAKSKETRQYEKIAAINEYFTALEYGVKFRINLIDYLDTGLFLDHRETRMLIAHASAGKRVLNLFAYTCSFSVHAAVAGATYTKSVDMSNTYTAWGRENFILNDLSTRNNEIVRADCLKFIDDEIRSGTRYDIVIVDPPTLSRSKKMDQLFDIQVDYIALLKKSMALLNPKGVMFFSTNSRKFIFDNNAFTGCRIEDISHKTLPIDFHDPKIHRCWKITI
ncbi:MAG: class I SAM-dependent methyltransferase [Parachlamydiaceae bacterium]|nr:class I SAM-dependent methyltransferase [Parachlamydiaceae bacterium]